MKKNCLCAALVSAALLLLAGCGGGMTSDGKFETYDDGAYTAGSGSVSTAEAYQIDIEWAAGDVLVTADPFAKSVSLSEDYAEEDACALRYRVKEGVLDVKYAASGADISALAGKTLRVTVPTAGVAGFSVKTDSANVRFTSVSCPVLNAETVSGEIAVTDFRFEKANFKADSGSVALSFAEGTGFDLTFDSKRGNVVNDLGALAFGWSFQYGGGGAKITVETESGVLTLRKN